MTKFEFERLSIPVYQCLVQVCKVTSESDPSSLQVASISAGMEVTLTSLPQQVFEGKVRKQIAGPGTLFGWVTTGAHGRSCFLRVWPSISLQPWDMLDGSEMTDGEEDRNIDEAWALRPTMMLAWESRCRMCHQKLLQLPFRRGPKQLRKLRRKPEE